jgi:hypothetical protein
LWCTWTQNSGINSIRNTAFQFSTIGQAFNGQSVFRNVGKVTTSVLFSFRNVITYFKLSFSIVAVHAKLISSLIDALSAGVTNTAVGGLISG